MTPQGGHIRAHAAPPYFVDVVGLDLSDGLLRTIQDRLDVAQFLSARQNTRDVS